MKKWFAFFMAILLISMTACASGSPETPDPTQKTAAESIPAETVTEPAETEPPTTAPERVPPYTVDIYRPDFPIWDGPGYDYLLIVTVEESGVYTIVAEETDGEGNLWGQLKSGIGWIDLTLLAAEEAEQPLLSGNFAEEMLVTEENCYYYGETSEYTDRIAIRVYDTMSDVVFYSMVFTEDFEKDKELMKLESWDPALPFVADVSFPGDMSTYGIRFKDADDRTHEYRISVSGRNGSLIITEVK